MPRVSIALQCQANAALLGVFSVIYSLKILCGLDCIELINLHTHIEAYKLTLLLWVSSGLLLISTLYIHFHTTNFYYTTTYYNDYPSGRVALLFLSGKAASAFTNIKDTTSKVNPTLILKLFE